MPKYIDVEKIRLTAVGKVDEDGDILVSVRDVKRAIEQTPAADVVEVKRGEWETVYKPLNLFLPTSYMSAHIACSVCKYEPNEYSGEYKEYIYCPHCGARMDGEREGRE